MFKWIFAISMIVVSAYAQDARVEKLNAKISLNGQEGYFVLSDQSCWKVISFEKRWRTISEWWNNAELITDEYLSGPDEWFQGADIQVHSKVDFLHVNEANASNQNVLKQCTHMLVNASNGKILFAISLQPADCLAHLYQDAHKMGYNKGYNDGYYEKRENATEIRNQGYKEGYNKGYEHGYADGFRENHSR